MRSPLVGVIAMAVLVPLASESGARQQPVTVELKGCCTAKILSAKRARTWEGATDRGFTVKSAPEGRDFIVVKYELTPAVATESLALQYSKLEDAKGETYFATGGSQGVRTDSRAKVVDQFFSVPAGNRPTALLLGRFGPPPKPGEPSDWILVHRVDLRKVPVTFEK